MSELIPVNIVIADRNYRLRIEPKDEEMVRKTAGLINDKITEFKTTCKTMFRWCYYCLPRNRTKAE
jgi:cell division protein ZapA (FtsZ GTPase activity inhibitor)